MKVSELFQIVFLGALVFGIARLLSLAIELGWTSLLVYLLTTSGLSVLWIVWCYRPTLKGADKRKARIGVTHR